MPNLLEQLAKMTVIVADTGDIQQIERFRPRDATTNPTLVLQAAGLPQYESIISESVRSALLSNSNRGEAIALAARSLAIEFGRKILGLIDGRVSTEVDARASYDTDATVAQAKGIIEAYSRAGISPKRVLVKIASTWEGIRAAERLEREGIHTNLTLLFGFHQAVACADAGVTLISPFVGRILDWHKKSTGRSEYASHEDPGVVSVTRIYNYYKRHGYKTEVMGASFRNMGEITELAGCDLLTISPALLGELEASSGTLDRKLEPEHAKTLTLQREVFDAQRFAFAHAEDRMATDKLSEGIKGFSEAIVALETKLGEYADRLAR